MKRIALDLAFTPAAWPYPNPVAHIAPGFLE